MLLVKEHSKSSINTESARDIIYNAIMSMPGPKKVAGYSVMVQCPFHDDRTPSCGVIVSSESTLQVGSFHCLGCSAKGGWNKFAEKAGLPTIVGWKFYESDSHSAYTYISDMYERELLGSFDKHYEDLWAKLETREAIPWPKNKEWRGYSGKLLAALGAQLINDHRHDELMLGLPIKVNGKIKGAVRAVLEKRPGQTGYITSKGTWVKKYGLFPYDTIKKMVKTRKLKYCVLVEGPRDALRLISNGIPALAVLGSENVTKGKILLVLSMFKEIDIVYYMPDKDTAGRRMGLQVKKLCEGLVKAEKLLLPKIIEDGKVKKVDPDSCPEDYMQRVVDYLKEQHH